MSKNLKIGLFGFGVVGQGLLDIIQSQNLNLEIIKIAIKDPRKKRTLNKDLFTTDRNEILNNTEINTIVELINDADAVFICTPEYAFGVPGALKNAIDWTVGTSEFVDKPVALITAASLGKNAHAALLLIFKAISANIPEGGSLLIPYIRTKITEQGEIKDDGTKEEIMKVMQCLIDLIEEKRREN